MFVTCLASEQVMVAGGDMHLVVGMLGHRSYPGHDDKKNKTSKRIIQKSSNRVNLFHQYWH